VGDKKALPLEGSISSQSQGLDYVEAILGLFKPYLSGIRYARVFSHAGALFRQTLVGVLPESQTAATVSILLR